MHLPAASWHQRFCCRFTCRLFLWYVRWSLLLSDASHRVGEDTCSGDVRRDVTAVRISALICWYTQNGRQVWWYLNIATYGIIHKCSLQVWKWKHGGNTLFRAPRVARRNGAFVWGLGWCHFTVPVRAILCMAYSSFVYTPFCVIVTCWPCLQVCARWWTDWSRAWCEPVSTAESSSWFTSGHAKDSS